MGEHRRKADGRRLFATEFKRATIQRIVAGEKTVAELGRELDRHRRGQGARRALREAGAAVPEEVCPVSRRMRAADHRTASNSPSEKRRRDDQVPGGDRP